MIATQILWINLVTDGLPGVALGVDPYDPGLMLRKPRDPKEPIITKRFASTMVIRGVSITVFILVLFYLYGGHYSWLGPLEVTSVPANAPEWFTEFFAEYQVTTTDPTPLTELQWYNIWNARSVLFNCLAAGELINAFNSRSENGSLFKIGIFSNMALFWSVIISMGLTVFIFYTPPVAVIFRLFPLNWHEWLLSIAFALPVLITVEILKIFYRKQSGIDFHMNIIR